MKVLWAENTWQELGALVANDPVVIVPTGSMEQHGPHLPVMVDSLLSYRVAELAARKAVNAATGVLVTPPVWTGYSPHHMDFAGTITLSASTFMAVLTDVAKSLHHHGFRRILFLNGHGGNTNLVRSTVQSLRFEHGVSTAGANYWDLAAEQINAWRQSPLGGVSHACEFETSLAFALRQDLVSTELIEDHMPKRSPLTSLDLTKGGPVTVATSFSTITQAGTLGAPSLASKERGEQILEAVTGAVAEFLAVYGSVQPTASGEWVL